MTKIIDLTRVDAVTAADFSLILSGANNDARLASFAVIATYLQTLLAASGGLTTQYASPSATAFNIQITNSNASTFLLLTPTAGFAAGTLTLPLLANCVDKQELLVTTTQAVTTLTVAPNGATLNGAPTTLAANAFFRLRFDGINKAWYRVG